MAREIRLRHGEIAIIDDDMYPRIVKYKWYSRNGYACACIKGDNGGNRILKMHRLIAGTPDGFDTDHINRDRLDNRKANLRICTRSQNAHNSIRPTGNTSQYRGVSKYRGKWIAKIKVKFKTHSLGVFRDEISAALAYNKGAIERLGEFAQTNKIPDADLKAWQENRPKQWLEDSYFCPECGYTIQVNRQGNTVLLYCRNKKCAKKMKMQIEEFNSLSSHVIQWRNTAVVGYGKSPYRGVSWHNQLDKWQAKIGVRGKRIFLGVYSTDKEAAVAYNDAATKHLGDKAILNQIKEGT